MAAPLLSNAWYRVADRRPKLRSHARLHRHRYRGEVWFLLQDPASSRVHRFTPAARFLISLMDGRRTVAELWQLARKHLGEGAPTQDEMVQLLGQLHAADLLQSDVTPDVAELFARSEREERARYFRSFANPMAIRVPLWDPDRFLNRIEGLIRLIWSRWGAILWLAVVVPAVFLISPHWPELTNDLADRVLSYNNLFALYMIFPLLKAAHELGHATATKAGGGEVHDLGFILLVLLPVPYVEASASTVFRSKYRRAVVGAAGVLVELFIAALAFYAWLLVEPGLTRALLFNVMLIASVSTLMFNGNPLLRYDAYYILADLLEIPNLAARSARYWGYIVERYILGVRDAESPNAMPREKAWFVFYGAAATAYRLLVTVVIAFFIASRFFFIGVLLAGWGVAAMTVFPLIKGIRHLAASTRLRRHRRRAIAAAAIILMLVGGGLFLLPVPYHTHSEGVVWLSEDAMVRAGANGFLADFLVPPRAAVTVGTPLIQSEDPLLQSQLHRAQAKVAELEAQYDAEFVADRGKAQVLLDRLDSERANLQRLIERQSELSVSARADGVFIAPDGPDMPGRYYRKGELLGYVVGPAPPLIRVVIPQSAVDRVRLDSDRVEVRAVDQPGVVWQGKLVRAVPSGGEFLPSKALAIEGGGEIATDPRETKGPKALQRVFQFDVELQDVKRIDHFGQRVFVRFAHTMEPLGIQWYRSVRLLFLSSFNV
jgi:putative peptide zinc metalloprotease protein